MRRTAAKRFLVVLAVLALLSGLLAVPAGAKPKKDQPQDRASSPAAVAYDALGERGSLHHVVDQIGARELWADGITGAGIDVAVIDTGLSPVPAFSDPDQVAAVVDLSFEGGVPELAFLDTYGHGTHMAGIIAGRDPGVDPATASPDDFLGVAPDARIVSVKVADNTGAVDVSQVIAGIDWVVQHRDAEGLNIRVINLSYGTDSTQPADVDPLVAAVERAWDAGIVVVVAAGNDGRPEKGLSNPARSPYVIAVGAAELRNNGKWKVAKYSTSGSAERTVDVVAPGTSIDSLRVPGSRADVEHPEGYVSGTLFRGSGSSQAAAVVSGGVALLLQARPDLTPDQVKALLRGSAESIRNTNAKFQGEGLVDLAAAAAAPVPDAEQTWPRSTGAGSLEAARGSAHVVVDGVEVRGEVTVWGQPFDGAAVHESGLLGNSWTGNSWTGSSWTGNSWTGFSWTGNSWTGFSWTGSSWTGFSWTGVSWTGSSWTGFSWTGNSWTGNSWTGNSWTGSSWTGSSWTGTAWG
ncbi:MAG: S8 family serine peptidase [Actinomycetota bacterium]